MARMEFGELGRGLQITEPVATDPDRIQGSIKIERTSFPGCRGL